MSLALVGLSLLASGCASDHQGTTVANADSTSESQQVIVPGVRGGTVMSAFFNLRRAGLRVAITQPFVTGYLIGGPLVRDQSPGAGVMLQARSVVRITALGPSFAGSPEVITPPPSAIVPDFRGKLVADAVAWTQKADLFWEASFPPLPPSDARTLLQTYVVTGQQPPPGSRLERFDERSRVTPLTLQAAPA